MYPCLSLELISAPAVINAILMIRHVCGISLMSADDIAAHEERKRFLAESSERANKVFNPLDYMK